MRQKEKVRSIRHTFRNIREDILKKRHTQSIQDIIIEEVNITLKLMEFMEANPEGVYHA
jgi:c-di-GMP-related signal transduction protein